VDAILEQYGRCKGNLVRVWEELTARGIAIPYSTLTAACRRRGIGVENKQPAGEYDFAPGKDYEPTDAMRGGVTAVRVTAAIPGTFRAWRQSDCT